MSKKDTDRLAEVVGRAIAKRRTASGLTQEQVAERLEIGVEAVSRIERGIVMPTVARLVELADIYDCNVADLLTEASTRAGDQAQHLSQLLSKLNSSDRTMIIELVERLAVRLNRR